MVNQIVKVFHGGWTLLRLIAVISSSVATIFSSMLPLFLYTSLPANQLLLLFLFLNVAAITFHGALTHLFNDYFDHLSGTDDNSPAILSGGSRIIQQKMMSSKTVYLLGKWLALLLLAIAIGMTLLGQVKLTILILTGVWAAASYSLPPLRLSYRPFLGEWLSLFPSIVALGLAGPWLILNTIPEWAIQNSLINAFVCMGWVMVHHIPDLEADNQAVPQKQTTVVWFANKFGIHAAPIPAVIYFMLAGFTAIWLGGQRPWATVMVTLLIIISIALVLKMNLKDDHQVSTYEKFLLLIAMIIAVVLGIF